MNFTFKSNGNFIHQRKNIDQTNVYVLNDDDALYDIFINNNKAAALMAILSTQHLEKLSENNVPKKGSAFLNNIDQGLEKTGIVTDIIDGGPVFLHRTFAEYFVLVGYVITNWLAKYSWGIIYLNRGLVWSGIWTGYWQKNVHYTKQCSTQILDILQSF